MLRSLLRKVAGSVPLSVHRLITRRDVLGFYYHVVSDEPLPHIRLYSYKSARMFESDLIHLAQNFNPITYEQLVAHRSGGQRLKPRSVILTFDDGLSECYSVVRPLLLKHGIPCVFFIPIDYIDNRKMLPDNKASLCIDAVVALRSSARSYVMRTFSDALGKELSNDVDLMRSIRSAVAHDHSAIDRLCQVLGIDVQRYLEARRPCMSSEEIRCLAADGFTIGAHSVSHRRFDSLTDLEAAEEISASCRVIASLSGKSQVPFAFPFSADGVSGDMLRELRMRSRHVGLLFDTRGVLQELDFMIGRMCGDWPSASGQEESTLQQVVADAYEADLVRRVRRLWARLWVQRSGPPDKACSGGGG